MENNIVNTVSNNVSYSKFLSVDFVMSKFSCLFIGFMGNAPIFKGLRGQWVKFFAPALSSFKIAECGAYNSISLTLFGLSVEQARPKTN